MRIETHGREFTSAAEMRAGYEAARARLWGPPPVAQRWEPPKLKLVEMATIIPLPPRPPSWLPDLIDFNEMVRGLFAAGTEKRLRMARRAIEVVAAHFNLTPVDLVTEAGARRHSRPRQIAIYICVSHLGMSLTAAGTLFNRDHSTILHARRAIADRAKENPSLAVEIRKLIEASA